MLLTQKQLDTLRKIPNIEVTTDYNLTKLNSLRLVASGDFILIEHFDALKDVILFLHSEKLPYRILGQGSNLVLPKSASWIYLKLNLNNAENVFDNIRESYYLSASTHLNILTQHAIKFGLRGWEVFTGIPASLGGSIVMNAGTNLGEIGNIIENVHLIKSNGELRSYSVSASSFQYRKNTFINPGDIIYAAELKHFGIDSSISQKIKDYLALRKKTQPLQMPTCGCVFKNRKEIKDNAEIIHRAGQLIDLVGLKGTSINSLKVSPLHANFFENHGQATKEDFLELVQIVQDAVQSRYGIKFELEVEIW